MESPIETDEIRITIEDTIGIESISVALSYLRWYCIDHNLTISDIERIKVKWTITWDDTKQDGGVIFKGNKYLRSLRRIPTLIH